MCYESNNKKGSGGILGSNRLQEDMPVYIKICAYIINTLFAICCILPVLLTLSISFTDDKVLGLYGYSFIPKKFSIDAYYYILENGSQIWRSYGITIFITILGVLLGLTMMTMFAYAITRPSFPWKNQFGFFSYFTMLFNGGMVATYIVNTQMYNLKDNIWILILTGAVGAYNILLMRTYMRNSIPEQVLEAARIDGANEFRCFIQFAVPMAVPMIATIALFMVVSYWNNWNTGMLYLVKRSDLAPIQLVLKRIENNINFLAAAEGKMSGMDLEQMKRNVPTESFRMAVTIMVAVPMIIAYPFFQRFFVKGITIGAVKG